MHLHALYELKPIIAEMLENAGIPFIAANTEGKIVAYNCAFCDLLGYSRKDLDKAIWPVDFTPPELLEHEVHMLERLRTLKKPQRFDNIYYKKDGSGANVEVYLNMISDPARNIIFYYSFIIDITKQKQVEKALEESDEKFRTLSETASYAILIYRKDRLCYVNHAAEVISGYSKEELLKMNFWDIVHPYYRDSASERWQAMQRCEPQSSRFETKILSRTGDERWADITSRCIEYERKPAILLTAYDITRLKQVEEALRESEGRLNAVIQGSPIPQFVIDKDHRVIYWNKALEQYSMIKASEVMGTDQHWKAFYNKKRPCMADLLIDGAVEEIPNWYPGKYNKSKLLDEAYEATDFFPTLAGEGKWLYFTATVIRDSNGKIIGAVETLEDVTDRKRAEEQLHEAKDQADIYLELMGHDINNMNQIGIGYLEMALQTLSLNENTKKFIAKPLEALKNSSTLIENVQKLQRISAGEMRHERIDLGHILADVRDQYLSIPGRDVTIKYSPVTGYVVLANELLKDAFSNIVGNAIKHSSGPVTINIELEKVSEPGKKYYIVSIDDNGPGIPQEMKDKLFTRFQRGKTKATGKGLGLYLVKSLVESYDGRIWVEDRVHGDHTRGSKFVVMLPAIEK